MTREECKLPLVSSLSGAWKDGSLVYLLYGLASHFNRIFTKFDQVDGRLHGLFHFTRSPRDCACPGCVSRRRESNPFVGALV